MHPPPKSQAPRRRSVLVTLFEFLTGGAVVVVVGLLAVAAFLVYQVGKLLAAQVLVTALAGVAEAVAAMAALMATLAAFLLVALAIMTLQTPLLLAPFGPVAEVLRFGLRVWVGHD